MKRMAPMAATIPTTAAPSGWEREARSIDGTATSSGNCLPDHPPARLPACPLERTCVDRDEGVVQGVAGPAHDPLVHEAVQDEGHDEVEGRKADGTALQGTGSGGEVRECVLVNRCCTYVGWGGGAAGRHAGTGLGVSSPGSGSRRRRGCSSGEQIHRKASQRQRRQSNAGGSEGSCETARRAAEKGTVRALTTWLRQG